MKIVIVNHRGDIVSGGIEKWLLQLAPSGEKKGRMVISVPWPMHGPIGEAMASRTPVVSTRSAGSDELIEDGVTGFLAPICEAEQLAHASMETAQAITHKQAASGKPSRRPTLLRRLTRCTS